MESSDMGYIIGTFLALAVCSFFWELTTIELFISAILGCFVFLIWNGIELEKLKKKRGKGGGE